MKLRAGDAAFTVDRATALLNIPMVPIVESFFSDGSDERVNIGSILMVQVSLQFGNGLCILCVPFVEIHPKNIIRFRYRSDRSALPLKLLTLI